MGRVPDILGVFHPHPDDVESRILEQEAQGVPSGVAHIPLDDSMRHRTLGPSRSGIRGGEHFAEVELAGLHGAEESAIGHQCFAVDVAGSGAVEEDQRPRLFLGG